MQIFRSLFQTLIFIQFNSMLQYATIPHMLFTAPVCYRWWRVMACGWVLQAKSSTIPYGGPKKNENKTRKICVQLFFEFHENCLRPLVSYLSTNEENIFWLARFKLLIPVNVHHIYYLVILPWLYSSTNLRWYCDNSALAGTSSILRCSNAISLVFLACKPTGIKCMY